MSGIRLYGASGTNYTDEEAQDAVGGILLDTATIDFTYDDATPNISADVKDDSITDAKLRESAGVSVIGRSANTVGNPADIAAGSDGDVLRRAGGVLGFGAIPESSVTNLTADLAALAAGIVTNAFTDEKAQDAVGAALTDTATVDLTYNDVANTIQADVIANTSVQKVAVRKNSTGGDIGTRRRMNLIEGTNITLTIADDAGDDEIDITIDATGGAYTDEQAQDAVGAMIDASLNYVDGTPLLQRAALTGDVTAAAGSNATTIANDAVTTVKILNDNVTYAKMQNISATSRILGRKTAAAGDTEECTLSEILDFVGSAAQGDILYRGAATWTRLAAGTAGDVLQSGGAGANPSWVTPSAGSEAAANKAIRYDYFAGY